MTWRLSCVLLLLVGLLPGGAAEAAEQPQQVIRQFCDSLLEVMKQGPQLGYGGRSEELRPAVVKAYDMSVMTRGAIGPETAKLSAAQLQQLDDAFTQYTVANYAEQFDGWSGERFEVDASRPATGGSVVVPSRIVPKNGEPTEIDYLMRQDTGGEWKIVDVLLDGTISQVAVRRSEFVSILRRDGPTGLLHQLASKTAALASK